MVRETKGNFPASSLVARILLILGLLVGSYISFVQLHRKEVELYKRDVATLSCLCKSVVFRITLIVEDELHGPCNDTTQPMPAGVLSKCTSPAHRRPLAAQETCSEQSVVGKAHLVGIKPPMHHA
eukprot:g1522.t1